MTNKSLQISSKTRQLLALFRRSLTYKLWRAYCRVRDNTYSLIKDGKIIDRRYFDQDTEIQLATSQTFAYWQENYFQRMDYFNQLKIRIWLPTLKFIKLHTPSFLKKLFKKYLFIYYYQPVFTSNKSIASEWKKWSLIRKEDSADIFIFGITSFAYRHQRPQHFASQLAKRGHRVFYIESEFVYPSVGTSGYPAISVNKIDSNLYTIKLTSSKNYFIYQDTVSSRDLALMFDSLKLIIKEAVIINPLVKIDHPFWASLADKLSITTVYDCMDEHGGFKETGDGPKLSEVKLIKNADLVLASSDLLLKRILKVRKKDTLLLKNAGEYPHFAQAQTCKLPIPKDIKGLKGPIIGYYGAVADWLDTDILARLAEDYPNASIVVIGRIQNDIIRSLADHYPNLHLLEEKPYAKLPAYLQMFDVCLIPFKINSLIKATNPVKIYEYFATGKPVVSTPIPELRVFKGLIYQADTPRQFSLAVGKALREKSRSLIIKRQQIAHANTWVKRSDLLEDHIKKALYPKVSIILVVYNNPDWTKISIDSILERSYYPNYELIVVDNNSDQATLKVLKSYTNNPRIKLIYNSANLGFAGGNNSGLKVANGDYIILINNDIRVTPGWITRFVQHSKQKGIGIIGPVTNNIGNEAKINIVYDPENISELEAAAHEYTTSHWNHTIELHKLAAFCWMKTKQTFHQVGYLDHRFGRGLFEDDDYCVRVRNLGRKIVLVEDVFIHHYGGKTTKWHTPEYQKLFNDNKKIFEDKWGIKWEPNKYRKGIL